MNRVENRVESGSDSRVRIEAISELNSEVSSGVSASIGAPCLNRTDDLRITSAAHYHCAKGADLMIEARIISEANEFLLPKDRFTPSTSREY
jgi:hypothetical protein